MDNPAPDFLRGLMERLRAPLLRRIRLMMGPRAREQAESADFLQQVFLAAHEHGFRLQGIPETDALRWLTAVARNRVHHSVRARRECAMESMTASISRLLTPTSSADEPGRIADRREQVEILGDVLQELKEDHQRVIELRDFEGLSFHAIAERLGRTEAAVQMLHARAMVKLGEGLKRHIHPVD